MRIALKSRNSVKTELPMINRQSQIAKLPDYPITQLQNRRRGSRGYILITLMLVFALLAIAAMAVLPQVKFQIQRDNEEEMRHRGTEYMRAIKKFYKKFGRYPARLEELENTNNLRFLRKRYKDPLTGQDFRLLHMQDVMGMMNSSSALGGGLGAIGGQAGLGGQGGLGALGGLGGLGGGNRPGGGINVVTPQGGAAQPLNPGDQSGEGDDSGNSPGTPAGGNPGNAGGSSSGGVNPGGPLGNNSGSGSQGLGGQVFGGGPILGVASKSKEKSIRVFNKKDHYKDWMFYYDPSYDRGGLLIGPMEPGLNLGGAGGGLGGVQPGGLQGQGGPGQGGLNGGVGGLQGPQQQTPSPNPSPQPVSPQE